MANNKESVGIESLPMELYDLITLKANRRYGDDRYHGRSECAENRLERLKTLRLVSRPFYHSASRLLFRRISTGTTFRGDERDIPMKRFNALCRSPHAKHVETLCFGILGMSRPSELISSYVRKFKERFPRCLCKLTRLRTLEFDIQSICWDGHNGDLHVPPTIWRSFTDAIFEGLQDARLEHLQIFQIKFPSESTYCFRSEGRLPATLVPIQNSMSNLSSLHINHETRDPETEYQADMLRLLGLVESLHTLEISCWQRFKGISPVHLFISPKMNLRVLRLNFLDIPCQPLLYLLQKNKQTLEKIVFKGVYLSDGQWKDILEEICQLPSIHHVAICSCSYSWSGQSSFLRRPYHCYDCGVVRTSEIRSLSVADVLALHPVRHHLNQNREMLGLERIRRVKEKWMAGQYKYSFLGRFSHDF